MTAPTYQSTTQQLKAIVRETPAWSVLPPEMREHVEDQLVQLSKLLHGVITTTGGPNAVDNDKHG